MKINLLLLLSLYDAAVAFAASSQRKKVIALQNPHIETTLTPSELLKHLGQQCEKLNVSSFDVYGDFDLDKEKSYLRKFEAEIATEFGKEDAVFIPSGVMAQGIALLIHSKTSTKSQANAFTCHHTSHLILHEDDAFRELLQMEPLVISTKYQIMTNGYSVPPMRYSDVKDAFESNQKTVTESLHTLILELPHREIGGKCTPWQDILGIRDLCRQKGVKMHCDGARIFEATTGYDKTLKELAEPFDSVYISFYKGLAGVSGAMLMGSKEFCIDARKWLRRFGGNLYTLLPYAVSGWAGYKKHWIEKNSMTFDEKKEKLVRIVSKLSADPSIKMLLSFDPEIPEANMIHGYMPVSVDEFEKAKSIVEEELGIRVLNRVRPVAEDDGAYANEFRSKFEWTMGEANGQVDDETFLLGWQSLAKTIQEIASESG